MASMVVIGLGLAAAGFAGRQALRVAPQVATKMNEILKTMSSETESIMSGKRYYKGGFDPTMTKKEASLILDVSANAPKNKIKEAHKRIMLINHPDKGGSPYIAAKINEAKDLLDNK
ncbi:mitochondrial import inner membrane translocase subunit TIM14 [Daktulosphaira vitifoliae]|uniref:mitochondrial import inner membrane translocase subunit TIM14 n=1 Tax=Daktulosphaira vitifoliae TaxID=58002 RepID=UPI0021AAA23C|nr:mitochondrial import inner membrane translocase subunit TIM14 [Daktulosphaira vitifoliae]